MKKQVLWIALDAIFLIVFNVCFFVMVGVAKGHGLAIVPPSVWIGYAFIHLSYILLLCTPLLVRRGNRAMVDYGRPLFIGALLYFLVTLVVNLLFMLVSLNIVTASWLVGFLGCPVAMAIALIVNVVLFGVAMLYLVLHAIVNNNTADKQERHEQELQYVKIAASRLKGLVDSAPSKKLGAELEKLYYTVNSSPMRSCPAANDLEQQLLSMITTLENASDEEYALRLCSEMMEVANHRNRVVSENN